jgi:hypothetical protein
MLAAPFHRSLPSAEAHSGPRTRSAGASDGSTSTLADAAGTSPLELSDLSEHLDRCGRLRGRLFSALCFSDTVDRFLAPRFITTLVAVILLAAALLVL